ncbi:protein wntless homolog [Mytilus californianus]|uniref:protein wntless homolog n=1 Tax=Mytilus californianus TaxID=6549 RepID=UPI002245189E|nr:protein wntless homolog [Mytilus californianus]
MAGVVLENLSWKKLIILSLILLMLLVTFFLIGGLQAPQPNNVNIIIGTKCYAPGRYVSREKWHIPRGNNSCEKLDSLRPDDAKIVSKGITDKQIVFAFWIPGPRDGHELKMHPRFQYMMSVLQLDIIYQPQNPVGPNPVMLLDFRLGYRNEGDREGDWKLLAESAEDRKLVCTIAYNEKNETEPGSQYDCELLHAFEISSLHHDYYLLNLRLPPSPEKNIDIGQIDDISLVTIHQNGGFTIIWFSIKTFLFPCVLIVLVWFWRRIQQMCRPPNLLERTLFALGITMSILNLPIEWLTFWLNIPFMLLLNDIRQGAFYAMLLSFWIIFTGEHIMDQTERNRLKLYWKHLTAVIVGCVCLFVFEMCERGMQLKNPFYSIWSSEIGSKLALAFIILAAVAATAYFLFLCVMIYRVFRNISAKKSTLPSMSHMRKKYYMGLIFRFKFLMLLTLFCAALTVIFFIISQLSEGQWKWGDENLKLEYSSAFFTGVYGLWNVYIFGLLSLYAPSHKTASGANADTDSQEEEVQLTNVPSEMSALQSFATKADQD